MSVNGELDAKATRCRVLRLVGRVWRGPGPANRAPAGRERYAAAPVALRHALLAQDARHRRGSKRRGRGFRRAQHAQLWCMDSREKYVWPRTGSVAGRLVAWLVG